MGRSSAAGFAADAIIVGAGLLGLVAACELVDRGLRVLLVDIFARHFKDRSTVRFAHRHQVDELIVEGDAVTGVRGTVLEPYRRAPGSAFIAEGSGAV